MAGSMHLEAQFRRPYMIKLGHGRGSHLHALMSIEFVSIWSREIAVHVSSGGERPAGCERTFY
jgi:hypothetical protein